MLIAFWLECAMQMSATCTHINEAMEFVDDTVLNELALMNGHDGLDSNSFSRQNEQL